MDSESFEIKIEKVVFGGAGLGRYQGQVVFVPFSAPGDRLLVRPVQKKKNLIRAAIVEILEPGEGRIEAKCRHFGQCGGCQWQHLEYRRQVEAKRTILEETLHHRLPETRRLPITMKASPRDYGYRSRARLQLRGSGPGAVVGFYRFESHAVEDIDSCPLLAPVLDSAVQWIRQSRVSGAASEDAAEIEIAGSQEEGCWESTAEEPCSRSSTPEYSKADFPRDSEKLLSRKLNDVSYQFSPASFFQANDIMLEELLLSVTRLMPCSPEGEALDLYGGVGLFTLPLARLHKNVVSVESSRLASRLCEKNAAAAGCLNVRAVCSDVGGWMRAVGGISAPGYETVLLDPPRTGAGPEVMNQLRQWAPQTILYVSCDIQTLCRDLALLPSDDYSIDVAEGLDLFPQTYHFETIVRLRRR